MITWDLRFWVVFQKNIIQTEWAFTIFHDTTAKCCIVGLMWSVYNSTWHLSPRLSVKNYSSEIEWKRNFFSRSITEKPQIYRIIVRWPSPVSFLTKQVIPWVSILASTKKNNNTKTKKWNIPAPTGTRTFYFDIISLHICSLAPLSGFRRLLPCRGW